MPNISKLDDVEKVFMDFWNKNYDEIFLSMAGMADIWEGTTPEFSMGGGSSTIIATKAYNDKIFIAQGGGLQTLIKVISPNGIEIYDLGSQLNLLTHTAMNVYGAMAVINDHEIILGYMYINLKMLFMAPYGIDLIGFWRNPQAKVVPIRISTSSWIVAIRDSVEWNLYITNKESPEDCLPCATKENMADKHRGFECVEEKYGRHALEVSGYRASREEIGVGASMSVTMMGGYGKMDRINRPPTDNEKCLQAIDQYTAIFNKQKISPADVGEIGQKMSTSCSKVMYLNMLQIVEYKNKTKEIYGKYLKTVLNNEIDNSLLVEESIVAIKLIVSMLSELKNTEEDASLLHSIFEDQIWWSLIWFAGKASVVEGFEGNAYTLLHTISYNDFVEVITSAASLMEPPEKTEPLPMGWVIMTKKNQVPIKYGKESMTYFRFPFSICTSTRPLMTVDNMDFSSVCEVETRSDGILIWVWDDRSTLWNKQFMRLKCYKVSNDGIVTVLAEEEIGYTMSPIEDSAKAVGVSPDSDYWIIRDYYIIDSVSGGIGFVETKVIIPEEMQDIYASTSSTFYANINEMSGPEGSSTSTIKYGDGQLEPDWSKFDLDDDRIVAAPAWGNDGPQYRYTSGYTGYQISVSGEL